MNPQSVRRSVVALAAWLVLATVAGAQTAPTAFAQAVAWLPGGYSSRAQAALQPRYFAVSIQIAAIWPEAPDGPWFYLEQAMEETLDQPYRQAVMRAEALPDGRVALRNYRPKTPAAWVGAHRDSTKIAAFTPGADLEPLPHYVVLALAADGSGRLVGGTPPEETFPSTLRGAVRMTNETELSATAMLSWDRGWKADGTQAWGAVDGPYVFQKEPAAVATEQAAQP